MAGEGWDEGTMTQARTGMQARYQLWYALDGHQYEWQAFIRMKSGEFNPVGRGRDALNRDEDLLVALRRRMQAAVDDVDLKAIFAV